MKKKNKKTPMTRERQRSLPKVKKSQLPESIKIQRAIDAKTAKLDRIGKAIVKLTETKKKAEEYVLEMQMKLEEAKAREIAQDDTQGSLAEVNAA